MVTPYVACLCPPPTVPQCMLAAVALEALLAPRCPVDSRSIMPWKKPSACPQTSYTDLCSDPPPWTGTFVIYEIGYEAGDNSVLWQDTRQCPWHLRHGEGPMDVSFPTEPWMGDPPPGLSSEASAALGVGVGSQNSDLLMRPTRSQCRSKGDDEGPHRGPSLPITGWRCLFYSLPVTSWL